MIRNNSEFVAVPETNGGFRKNRASDFVHGTTRTHRVEPHCAQDIPGGSGAPIVISGYAQGTIAIPHVHQLAHMLLGLPRFSRKVIEVRNVKARLLPLRILAAQTRFNTELTAKIYICC